MVVFLTILATIIFVFAMHFVLVYGFGDYFKKKWPEHVLRETKRYNLAHDNSPSLMVVHRHFTKQNVDDDDNPFAHRLAIHYGGFCLIYEWGHDYKEDESLYGCDDVSRYYGLYSIDGEFPKNLWWGHALYDICWFRTKFVGKYFYNVGNGEFAECKKGVLMEDQFPPTVRLRNTVYVCKDGEPRNVNEIRFWLVERRYTSGFLKWLGLSRFFQKKYVYLEYETTGIGVSEEHFGYVSQCLGSDIWLDEEEHGEFLKLYEQEAAGYVAQHSKFMDVLYQTIDNFLIYHRKL